MKILKSKIIGEAKQSWAYEMYNKTWIAKVDVEKKGGGLGSNIEYTEVYSERYKKNVIDKIIKIEKGKVMIGFGDDFLEGIKGKTLAEKLSIDSFERLKENFKDKKMKSNSALRKVFETYLKIIDKEDFDVEKEILFAKIGYQEQRELFPKGFTIFLREIYKNLDNDKKAFYKFLEVFVAYHKYFNPNAK